MHVYMFQKIKIKTYNLIQDFSKVINLVSKFNLVLKLLLIFLLFLTVIKD